MGEKLGKFEVEKRQAVENEDYDKAKLKKVNMDEYRIQVYKDLHVHNLLEIDGVSIGIKYIVHGSKNQIYSKFTYFERIFLNMC